MQSCHVSDRALQDYLRGSLPDSDARTVEHHYLACRACNDRMVLLEWFPGARPVSTPPTPVTTIRCSITPERRDTAVLERAMLSARMGFELLAGSDQILGVTAVAAMAVLVLSVTLSVLPNRQEVRSEPAPVFAGEVFENSVATHSSLQQPMDLEFPRDDSRTIREVPRQYNPPDRNPFLYAKVFVPPQYTPASWQIGASEPVLHAAPPQVTFHVSAPHLPYEPPKLAPPHTSRIKSVLKVLSWPFRSERRESRPDRTIS